MGIMALLPTGLGFRSLVTLIQLSKAWDQRDLPSSWVALARICPVLRPRWDLHVRPFQRFDAIPAFSTTKTPTFCLYRGSITRLLRSLSTLHSHSRLWSCKTRFQLLAKLYWVGLATNRAAVKGFSLYTSSFPKLAWRELKPTGADITVLL